jgi:hypothetical protein
MNTDIILYRAALIINSTNPTPEEWFAILWPRIKELIELDYR